MCYNSKQIFACEICKNKSDEGNWQVNKWISKSHSTHSHPGQDGFHPFICSPPGSEQILVLEIVQETSKDDKAGAMWHRAAAQKEFFLLYKEVIPGMFQQPQPSVSISRIGIPS